MTWRNWLGYGMLGAVLASVPVTFLIMNRNLRAVEDQYAISLQEAKLMRESPDVETLRNSLAAANDENRELAYRLERAENMVALLEASVDDTLQSSLSDVEELLDDADADGPTSPFQDVLESMDPDAMAKMQATNMVSMGYRRLFRELGLDAQTEAAARAIILEETEGQMREMFAQMKDADDPMSLDNQTSPETLQATIRERLGTLLAEDHLQILDDYDVDYEMIAGGIETQLLMYAPELSDESATLARDVLVEELLASSEEIVEVELDGEFGPAWDRQIQSVRNAEARLAEMLSEDEMIRFRRYVDQNVAMAESMRAMMEGFDEDEDEDEDEE